MFNKVRDFALKKYLSASKPNLLLVGPPKCASTFLYAALANSPDVYCTKNKELRFFSNNGKLWRPSAWRYYKKCFDHAYPGTKNFKYLLDATPSYFEAVNKKLEVKHSRHRNYMTPLTIRRVLGDNVKIIIVIRNPIMRSISHYFHHVKVGRMGVLGPRSIFEVSNIHPETLTASNYSHHIPAWEKIFDKNQLLYINYFDIRNRQEFILKQITDFLEVEFYNNDFNMPPLNEGFDLIRTTDGICINVGSSRKANLLITDAALENLKKYVLSDQQRSRVTKDITSSFKDVVISTGDLEKLVEFHRADVDYVRQRFPEMREEMCIHETI